MDRTLFHGSDSLGMVRVGVSEAPSWVLRSDSQGTFGMYEI